MKSSFFDRIGLIVFVVSLAIIAMVYGTVSSMRGWFPAPQIKLAQQTLIDVASNWKNDLALEPTRHLVDPGGANTGPDRGKSGGQSMSNDGYVLVAGLNEKQDESFHVVHLYDRAGEEVHRWPVHYEWLDSERKPQNVMLHGMEVFKDGSLALTFDGGNAIARIDACGKPIWTRNGIFHHSISRDGEGRLVTLLKNGVAWIDEDSGEILHTLDVEEDMITVDDGAQQAMFNIRTRSPEDASGEISYLLDPFHINDAEPLHSDMASAFPMFEAGDVLISFRELNLVAVVDPESGRMKWWQHGPWFKQHDPDFEPDGRITVYDNGTGTGASKIRRIRPVDGADVETLFAGSEEVPFYTWRRGKHQTLPNGNILLTEAEGGRVLEVTPEGELVWERHMVWDAEKNLIITEARFVPEDFFKTSFDSEVPDCDSR
ncbi:arylsulfotransferase family protein [Halomonas stenophila]|uniref:Aryl sulfotransferase n=1 Tax=Halomonas stenophila TaxID=795312 RepID=A0A7W5ERT7_9GAMM|nr:hypothetical protein [Halomonas stenophila]